MSVRIPSSGRVVSKSMKVSKTPPPMLATGGNGASGGSGIVIIRYRI